MNRKNFIGLSLSFIAQVAFAKNIRLKKNSQATNSHFSYIISPYKNKNKFGFYVHNLKTNTLNRYSCLSEMHGVCRLSATQILLISKNSNSALLFDLEKQLVSQEITPAKNRLFYGHGCADQKGFVYISQTDKKFQGYLSKRSIKNLSVEVQEIKLENSVGIHDCKYHQGNIYVASNGNNKNIPGSVIAYDTAENRVQGRIEYDISSIGPQHLDIFETNLYICSSSANIDLSPIQESELKNTLQIYNIHSLLEADLKLNISKNLANACLSVSAHESWLAATSRNENPAEKIVVTSIAANNTKNEFIHDYPGEGCIFFAKSFIFFSRDQEPIVFDFEKKSFFTHKDSRIAYLNIQDVRSNAHAYVI